MATFRRFATAALLAGALSLTCTSWASAESGQRDGEVGGLTAAQCQKYLADAGYVVGNDVINACAKAAGGDLGDFNACSLSLQFIGVAHEDATIACRLALP
ncbi:hypothetical protein [Actinokineospora iranica]|uniref:hypothetical protein n=1 Tax=Actinokineospora iranica TaxID=1271860 RepID=UPI001113B7D2|nr:hypothetical protein [Actinokineospora iranica]